MEIKKRFINIGNDLRILENNHGFPKFLRAVPFKSVGGRRNGRFFEGGEGLNSELIFPIRFHIIPGRRGGGCRIFNYLPFLPPTTLLNGTALNFFSIFIIILQY